MNRPRNVAAISKRDTPRNTRVDFGSAHRASENHGPKCRSTGAYPRATPRVGPAAAHSAHREDRRVTSESRRTLRGRSARGRTMLLPLRGREQPPAQSPTPHAQSEPARSLRLPPAAAWGDGNLRLDSPLGLQCNSCNLADTGAQPPRRSLLRRDGRIPLRRKAFHGRLHLPTFALSYNAGASKAHPGECTSGGWAPGRRPPPRRAGARSRRPPQSRRDPLQGTPFGTARRGDQPCPTPLA